MVRKLRRSEFTLEDYRDQLGAAPQDGPARPGAVDAPGPRARSRAWTPRPGEREMKRAAAIIDSMTPAERREPVGPQREPAQAHRARERDAASRT